MNEPVEQPQTQEAGEDHPAEKLRALIDRIEDALDVGKLNRVEKTISKLHSADVADLLEQLHPDDRKTVIDIIRPQLSDDPEFLTYVDDEIRDEIVALLHPEEVASAIAEMESDDAVALVEDLDKEEREEILSNLPTSARLLVEEGLSFPEDSAGRLMQREMVAVPMFWTVGKTIDFLRTSEDLPNDFYMIFMIDPMYKPVGGALLSRVLRSRRSVKLADIMDQEVRTIPAEMDREEVAFLFSQYGLVSAPVVDENGRLLGVITVDDVVEVIEEENEEDMLKLGGVQEEDRLSNVSSTARKRLPWLAVNSLTALLAASVISFFEATIAQLVALAVLMPIVASMGGNAGTQTMTVTVRALATKDLAGRSAQRMVVKELAVGAINGLLLAMLIGLVATLWFSDPWLGSVISMAMIVTLIIAALTGATVPLILHKLKIDPAVASGIFLTMVTDIVGFFTFLGLAAWILL